MSRKWLSGHGRLFSPVPTLRKPLSQPSTLRKWLSQHLALADSSEHLISNERTLHPHPLP
ncbi:hypothetical protein CVV72_21955 [Amycolatopsis sp. TNS106]|nr:hypothetical protein CVV72_21955 [Amycolatopsis sp. TNS106]